MPHRARLPLSRRHPVHVALRVEPTLPSLRQSRLSALVRQCLRETYLALRYVLLNGRRHDAQRGRLWVRGVLDPCSSAPFFDSWLGGPPQSIDLEDAPVVAPRTFLLRQGWRAHGLLDPDDIPGPRSGPRPRRRPP